MSEREVCAVCGQGGYWVAWSAEHGELRCANHITTDHHDEGCADFYPEYGAPEGGVCKVCGEEVTDRTIGASEEGTR